MSPDLAAFIGARLDEDEAVARRNIGSAPGTVTGLGDTEEGGPSFPDYQTYDGEDIAAACDYLNQFRPLRTLREVEAKRAVLAWYADSVDASALFKESLGTGTHMAVAAESYLNVIRGYAAAWSDHADYRQEWAP